MPLPFPTASRPALLALALLVAFPAHGAAQQVLLVPQDFATIQDAVDAAGDGDTILVKGGTYDAAVVVTGRTGLLIQGKGKVVIDPQGDTGLTLVDCTDVRVEKIRVANSAPHGFHVVDSTGCELVKCRVDLCAEDGIRIDGGGGNVVEKCTVSKPGEQGVALAWQSVAGSDDNLVTGCKVQQPGEAGVAVHGSGNTVAKCTVTKAFGDGFLVEAGSTGNEVSDSKAVKPGFLGVGDSGAGTRWLRVTLVGPGADGIELDGAAGATVTDCKVTKAGGAGLLVGAGSDGADASGNKLTKSTAEGLRVAGNAILAQDTKIAGSSGDGVLVEGDDGSFTTFKVTGGKQDGFRLAAGSSGNTLGGNLAKGNKGFDLHDESGGANTIVDGNSFGTTDP